MIFPATTLHLVWWVLAIPIFKQTHMVQIIRLVAVYHWIPLNRHICGAIIIPYSQLVPTIPWSKILQFVDVPNCSQPNSSIYFASLSENFAIEFAIHFSSLASRKHRNSSRGVLGRATPSRGDPGLRDDERPKARSDEADDIGHLLDRRGCDGGRPPENMGGKPSSFEMAWVNRLFSWAWKIKSPWTWDVAIDLMGFQGDPMGIWWSLSDFRQI